MRFFNLLLSLFSLLLGLSCSNRQMEVQLDEVESYIGDHPDKALVVLESIPQDSLNTKALVAHFSLLYAMALDKNYIDTTDVNIIEPAVRYYGKHGTADEKMKAYYYQGIANMNGEEYDKAIVSFTRAEKLVEDVDNPLFEGLLYSRISDLYNRIHNSEDELNYVKKALNCFQSYGNSHYINNTYHREAQAYINCKEYELADSLLRQIIEDTTAERDVINLAKTTYAHLLLLSNNQDPKKACKLFSEVIEETRTLPNMNLWSAFAFTLNEMGETSKSDQLLGQLESLLPSPSVIDIWKSKILHSRGDDQNAYLVLNHFLPYQDSLLKVSLVQSTLKAQRDYYDAIQMEEQERYSHQRQTFFFILLILLLSIITVFIRFRRRQEYHKQERARLQAFTESALQQIKGQEDTLSALRSEHARLFQSKYKLIGDLCQYFVQSEEMTDPHRSVYNRVKDLTTEIRGDEKSYRQFEKRINQDLNQIMSHFRMDFPDYSENDYRFVCYSFAGFDATAMSVLFDMPSVPAVYTKKSRIRSRINDSSSEEKELYLQYL